jgi:hypothetical protein
MVKHKLAAVALTTGLAAGIVASPASGDPGVGQPTFPSCFGQNASGFAQQYGGIAHAAETLGVTIPEGHNIVRGGFCGRTSGIVPEL